ncbi:MAG: hypothetical protein IPL65_13680 [Lewinellaceae bacterium]|nr:hypothetical protein [Lewinellaceae bacterium]
MRKLCFLLLSLWMASCSTGSGDQPQLVVRNATTVLRSAPGPRGNTLRNLEPGETVVETGQISDFFTPLAIGDSLREAPWIQVQCSNQQKGWVYALQLGPSTGDYALWLQSKNMAALLQPDLFARYQRWRAETNQLDRATDLLPWYQQTCAFREGLQKRLQHRPERNDADYLPQFYWLQNEVPAMVLQWPRVGEAPVPYLDFRFCLRKAQASSSPQDDVFFRFCTEIFPADSIASELPVWVMPISPSESYSQMGTGIHAALLHEIDSLSVLAPSYAAEWNNWKDQLLHDFLDKDRSFWQPADSINAETAHILAAPPHCLSQRDVLAIQERKSMLEDPEANGIRVNLRSGN